jgi:Putative adhesin
MATWTVDEPGKLELDQGRVDRVRVRLIEGAVSVVGSDGSPALEVSHLEGEPLRVRQEDGTVTVDYERPWRPGLLGWLTSRGQRRAVLSLAVPRECPVELEVVSASLMVGGLRAPVQAKTVSGEITRAGLGGAAEAESVSGAVQASAISGDLSAASMSGDLTVAEGGGSVRARTISGTIAMDLGPSAERDVELSSVSGDVTVRLPEASDLEVRLRSTSGQVASAFEELRLDRTPGRHEARGRIGTGTGRLRATSTSGHVALLRRGPAVSS